MAALFHRVDPRSGDLLVDARTDDFIVQIMTVDGQQIELGPRTIMYVPLTGRTAGVINARKV